MKAEEALLLDRLLAARDARLFVAELDWPGFAASRLHQNAVPPEDGPNQPPRG